MNTEGIVFRKLFFSGKDLPQASLDFELGLNIIFGGSNAGKSFILRALDFMLGASKLSLPREGEKYEQAYLWIHLPLNEQATLCRSTRGGDITVYSGFLNEDEIKDTEGQVLKPTISRSTKSGNSSKNSLSEYILEKIGIENAKVTRNEQGETNRVSLRMLSPFMMVAETEMISEASPITQRGARLATVDKSLFRFLLSGKDDSSIVAVPSAEKLRANRDGKVELLRELLESESKKVEGQPALQELEERSTSLDSELQKLQDELLDAQSKLDELQLNRRDLVDQISKQRTQASEYRSMLARFEELGSVYASDIDRLEGLDEAGFLTKKLSKANCPLCGSDPEHQKHTHGLENIELQREAIGLEVKKIQLRQLELEKDVSALNQDLDGVLAVVQDLTGQLENVERNISKLRPIEGSLRREFQKKTSGVAGFNSLISARRQINEYQGLLADLTSQTFGRQRADGFEAGVDSFNASKFSESVRSVLEAWNFPDVGVVTFSDQNQDIIVNGRERHDNGKGVRAILHSAFKVGLALHCRNQNQPHPSMLVLDSPLVTYRGPLQVAKYGELQEDEERLKSTSLNTAFYQHLAKNFSQQQVIILENQDPPEGVEKLANVVMFGGEKGEGRQGFFPPLTSS